MLTNYSEVVNIRTFGVLLLPINSIKNEIGSKKLFIHPLTYWLLKCCGLTCNFFRGNDFVAWLRVKTIFSTQKVFNKMIWPRTVYLEQHNGDIKKKRKEVKNNCWMAKWPPKSSFHGCNNFQNNSRVQNCSFIFRTACISGVCRAQQLLKEEGMRRNIKMALLPQRGGSILSRCDTQTHNNKEW